MNPQFEEIVNKTDAWCNANFPSDWLDRVDEYLPQWNNKFAELIVRECVNILTEESERLSALAVREKNAYCFDNLSSSADKCEDMAMFFEKHFGLENERAN